MADLRPSRPASNAEPAPTAWLAARLFAIAPAALGGIVVHAAAGPVRDRWLSDVRNSLAPETPWRHVPVHVDEERLLGGIDLAATLHSGRPTMQRGLLAEGDGGVVLMAMAERAAPATVSFVAAALDRGVVVCARDGVSRREPACFGLIALDESGEDDPRVAEALRDRCAFHVDLRAVALRDLDRLHPVPAPVDSAAVLDSYASVSVAPDMVEAMCAAALMLGIGSIRACLLAVRVARMAAACAGRVAVEEEDAELAAALVLAPRATRLPASAGKDPAPDSADREPAASEAGETSEGPPQAPSDASAERSTDLEPQTLEDRVLSAAAAAMPVGLLARLAVQEASVAARATAGRAGSLSKSRTGGRPSGVRRERPRGGARLDLMATLRAAVPWQRLRGRESAPQPDASRLRIRAEDLHVRHFQQRGRTTTVFAVDASGSAALHRLAEAKGAVELLLAECYVRRDSVAVIGFRGSGAEVLLPPTRSLVRAKRALAELPGGGGTPLAAGLDLSRQLALALRRRGDTPVVIVLSDGRANVARDGSPGRARAAAEAAAAARAIRAEGLAALFIDTSPQPHPAARDMAIAMSAGYLPLPHAESASLAAAARGAAPPARRGR